MKRERYYSKRFTRKQELVQMIECYIRYYNTGRVRRNLGVLTPMENTSCVLLHKKRLATHWLPAVKIYIFFCPLDGKRFRLDHCFVIVISFHEQKYPLTYYFR